MVKFIYHTINKLNKPIHKGLDSIENNVPYLNTIKYSTPFVFE